ncbi:MAG: biotin/acetyl-CoA-carboxylase ligase [Clostridia bacterium]|jgi:BirA family biotin operon repressor/biotin-[acetyl-CoA-carboxylase] ligase|nr:biotin/acetyl-CoA-carboxylase ligase [Clostridia bacterium]
MKEKVLEFLKSQKEYISGEEISSKLGITRAGVWKNINKLKEEGYNIESMTRKGYRLKTTPDIVTKSEVSSIIQTKVLGKDIRYYEQINSTNDMAKTLARENAAEGTVVIADRQIAGKGRLGKNWDSPGKTGIWMSMILKPDILPMQASQLTLLAGLSVCEGISRVTGLECRIKWPNDVVINGKKVCGILTEMNAELDGVNYIVVGIGINVNTKDFPEGLSHATSLSQEGGKQYMRRYIIKGVLEAFEKDYMIYKTQRNIGHFLQRYKDYCITLNSDVKIITHQEEYTAYAKDIAKDGSLVIINAEGQEETIFSGEVSVRGLYGYI